MEIGDNIKQNWKNQNIEWFKSREIGIGGLGEEV
jgi:hypothetical protein